MHQPGLGVLNDFFSPIIIGIWLLCAANQAKIMTLKRTSDPLKISWMEGIDSDKLG